MGKATAILSLMVLLASGQALAGGFEFPTNGTVALGRGGAFTALANDLLAIDYNPAGLLKLDGTVLYLGNNMSSYNVTYTPLDADGNLGDPVSNEAGLFAFAPFVAVMSDLGTDRMRFAVAAYGPSAYGRSHFPDDGSQRYMLLDTDVVMALFTASAAFRVNDRLGFGVSLHWVDLMAAKFSLLVNGYCMDSFKTQDDWIVNQEADTGGYDVRADVNVSDPFGLAATIGGWWKPIDRLEIGLAARLPTVDLDASGETSLEFQGQISQKLYQKGIDSGGKEGLVAYGNDGTPTSRIPTTMRFSYPLTARLGIRYVHPKAGTEPAASDAPARELFDIEADVVYERWSALESYYVSLDGYMRLEGNVTDAPNLTFAPVNIPKHYQDTWSFRLGGQVEPLDWLQLRAGGYFETGAVPEAYTNLDFASFDRMGVGGGTSFLFSGFTLSLAYSHVFQADRTVTSDETEVYKQYPTQPDTPPNLPQFKVGAGKFETSYDVFSAAVSYGF